MRKKEVEKISRKLKGNFPIAQKVLSVFLFDKKFNKNMAILNRSNGFDGISG